MRISDWSSDVCSSDLGQIRLPEDDGYSHLKLKLEQGGFFGPVARLCASRHLIAGGVKPDNCIRLCEWPYDQSLLPIGLEIGRASWRERVCQYVKISVVAVSLQKKKQYKNPNTK